MPDHRNFESKPANYIFELIEEGLQSWESVARGFLSCVSNDAIRDMLSGMGISPESCSCGEYIADDESQCDECKEKAEIEEFIEDQDDAKIPGFFPSPNGEGSIGQTLVGYANLQPSDKCLEPSSGIGSLADLIADKINIDEGGELCCVERIHSMAEICRLKGHRTEVADFLEDCNPGEYYDKVVMNPPFEKQQDAEHICHAFGFLAPGGRLVALCGANALNRDNAKGLALRSLVDEYGTHQEQIEGAFSGAGSFKQTNVSVLLLVIDKP